MSGVTGLEVIGAGFGRSGTTSLREALQTLGYDPCYHMQVTLAHYSHMKFWVRARAGTPVDFAHFFRAYRATVDWPACEFWRELLVAYPDARVILNIRDPDAWYDSMTETLWAIRRAFPWWFPRIVRRMHRDVIWNGRFRGEFANREKTLAVYRAHLEEICRNVPPGRLLVFDVAEGWQPLCHFLSKPVPDGVAFPHLNDRRFFRRVLFALRLAEWMVPAMFAAGLLWAAWRLL